MTLTLWYWPGDPGRGEYIRLPLEAGKIAYSEPAREAGDDSALGSVGIYREWMMAAAR